MKISTTSDKIAFAALIATILASAWGVYQYTDTQKNEKKKLIIDNSEFKRYRNAKYDFSLNVPTAWVLHPQSQVNDGFVFSHPFQDIEIRTSCSDFWHVHESKEISDNIAFLGADGYNFDGELEDLLKNKHVEILHKQRVQKNLVFGEEKNKYKNDLPALWLVYRYYDDERKIERISTTLWIVGTNIGNDNYPLVMLDASVTCSKEIYESNKDFFSKIILSLEFDGSPKQPLKSVN